MDVAIPIRSARPDPDHLIWALRTMEKHYPSMERVFIVGGDLPQDLDPEAVVHVPVPQDGPKFVNIGNNVLATLETDISEDFLWTNDDIFFLKDVDEIPLYCRTYTFESFVWRIREAILKASQSGRNISQDFNDYLRGMIGQWEILRAWGDPDPQLSDLHVPVVLNKTRLAETMERVAREFPDHELGHFRALYAHGQEATPFPDYKIQRPVGLPSDGSTWVSTNLRGWSGEVGEWIRGRYSSVSKFERKVLGSRDG